jgi:hypothetical protein
MSITRSVLMALVAVSALTVMAPGQAETPAQEGQQYASYSFVDDARGKVHSVVDTMVNPLVNPKELACLARNIFFEAGGESRDGKVAVGLVTLNRKEDGRFASTICGVVDQKTTMDVAQTRTVTQEVKTGWLGKKELETRRMTVWNKLTVCQFSWRCMTVHHPKSTDQRWIESQEVALELLSDDSSYGDLRDRYGSALYFHATSIRPSWSRSKERVGQIGGHFFYSEPRKARLAQIN